MFKKICSLVALFTIVSPAVAWEVFDRVVAVVNDTPIIQSELYRRYQIITKKQNPKNIQELNPVLDNLIEKALIEQEAREQAIIVSDEKVMSHISKVMKAQHINSLDNFKKIIEEREGITFAEYYEEVRQSLLTEMLVSLAIGVSPPSQEEAYQWYKENKNKLGYEVNIKQIMIRPKSNSFSEEKRVSDTMKQLRERLMKGESFEKLAQQYSEDITAKSGGDMGWIPLAELDPYLANVAFKMKKNGEISEIIKSQSGYHIIKFIASRPVTFENIQDKIMSFLYQRNMADQFKKWILNKRLQSDIKIYLENYKES